MAISQDRQLADSVAQVAVEQLGIEAFDNRLIAVDEFHHVSASEDNRLGSQLAQFIRRDKAHIVAMTGSYFRGDAVPVLTSEDEAKFETVKIADLVDDSDPARRGKVLAALKDPAQRNNRDHVDIIIALGMAKEGFDWIWCEHALTVGYRSSLTEIIQIIGRATPNGSETFVIAVARRASLSSSSNGAHSMRVA